MKPLESELQQYIQMIVDMYKKCTPKNYLKYRCFEEFLQAHGQFWTPSRRPKGMKKRKDGECFKNAAHFVLNNSQYVYVEGLALNIIPTLHAWAVDPETNVVIDLTWRNPEKHTYFGVPFKTNFLIQTLSRRRYYGLIDNMQEDFPLLRGIPTEEFLWTKT